MSQLFHVQSNLMLTPRLEPQLDQRRVAKSLADSVMRHGVTALVFSPGDAAAAVGIHA